MGTRADFYVGRGEDAEYLGSVTWDGYPDGFSDTLWDAGTEDEWRNLVKDEGDSRDDWTDASEGWPWPWDNSCTTDYAYAFEDGVVYGSYFGRDWFVVREYLALADDDDEMLNGGKTAVLPDMSKHKMSNDEIMARSGLIIVTKNET